MVIFEKIKIGGNINLYVSKENYTKTFTTVNTIPGDYRQATLSANVSMYSLADENLVTVKGQLTIETDLTNRIKEVVEGTEVRVFNQNLPNGAAKAFIGTSDAEGKYEIMVPVNADGNDNINVAFISVETMRTVGVNLDNVYSVETQNAIYDIEGNNNPTNIPAVPSALITIGAPEALGTGFALTTEVDTNSSIFTSSYSNLSITTTGSGYFPDIAGTDTTLYVFFSPDTKLLDTARIQLTFEKNGGLTSIGAIINYGTWNGREAKYSTKPTIDLNIGGGTGADIRYDFKLNYDLKISNNGTGYIALPTVKKTYVQNGVLYINTYNLSGDAFLSDGSIYAYGGGDLDQVGRYDAAPTYEVVVDPSSQASLYFVPSWMSTDGKLYTGDLNWVSTGSNYSPSNPPTVTITTLAGYGSGADFRAEVNSSGVISNIESINSGVEYERNINDFKNSGTTSSHSGDYSSYSDSYMHNVIPRDIYTVNAYYGTGQVTDLLNQ
jgi:hypothetical protein